MIRTPDIIPSNLRVIREMREKGTEETANALGMNRSYISILENAKANMSGETALRIMEYFDCSFAELFNKTEKVSLELTTETLKNHPTKIMMTAEEFESFMQGDIMNAAKTIEKEFKESNVKGSVYDINPQDSTSEKIENTDKLLVRVVVKMAEPKVEMVEFDMNISDGLDIQLYKALKERGFKENELFSIDFIHEYLDMDPSETKEALGLSSKGLEEILSGEKKVPVKIMWRMVKHFRVPLEMIMNIPDYKKSAM